MKIRHTFEFTDEERMAIARHRGGDHMATRAECIAWISATLTGMMEDCLYELENGGNVPKELAGDGGDDTDMRFCFERPTPTAGTEE